MMNARVGTPGKTRTCPHCKSTILESARVCPSCQHHLRFDRKSDVDSRKQPTVSALRVEGTVRNPKSVDTWEYSVVVSIRNHRGEEVERKVVGVGALAPDETRTVTLSVDVFTPPDAQ